jgi:Cu+-exporting ATPase
MPNLKISPPKQDVSSTPQTHCHHCGEICTDASITTDDKAFCCEGCKFVYELLRDNNLCTYYDISAQSGVSFKNVLPDKRRSRFDYLDDTHTQQSLLEFTNGVIAKTTFRLPQIHCSSCLWLLEKLHKLSNGIISSRVDFMRKEVSITFDPEQISLRGVVELLTTIGYEPELRQQNISISPNKEKNNVPTTTATSLYLKIGIAGFAFGNTMIFSFPEYLSGVGELDPRLRMFFGVMSIALALPVLLYSASGYFQSSWQSLKQRHINLDVPIAIGILALFVRSVVEIASGATSGYLDSFTGLVFLLLCGKLFQQKTFDSIAFDRDYKSYFPIAVTVRRKGREGADETTIPLSALGVGERMIIRNNELIPADSVLESAVGHVDYSFVTGESAPVEVLCGNVLYAGGRVMGAALEMTSVKDVSQSYLTSLWNNEAFQKHPKSALEQVSDTFGAYFTAFVLVLAGAAFLVWLPNVGTAVNAATAVLVIACPCAMTLAAPFALGWTLKIFGNAGFYLKNTSVVLELTRINAIVFDKTGTLTNARTNRVQYKGQGLTSHEQEYLAAALQHSTHPLTRSIATVMLYVGTPTQLQICDYEEIPSRGFQCRVEEHYVRVGSAEFVGGDVMNATIISANVHPQPLHLQSGHLQSQHLQGAQVHIAIDGAYKGHFTVNAEYRSGLGKLFSQLRPKHKLYLLSGDNDAEYDALSDLFTDDRAMAFFQTPQDKLDCVKTLQESGLGVAMVGDGLNDAGALRQSNVGIALAEERGTFSPACDAVMSAQKLDRLADFIGFAGYTQRVIIAAFWISVVYNIVGLSCAVMGLLSPLVSAVLMPLSNATVIGFTTAATILGAKLRKI